MPIAALSWLGIRILAQDRAMERQREVERLKLAASRAAITLEQQLAAIEASLSRGDGIQFSADGLGPGILYQPPASLPEARSFSAFVNGDSLEFQQRNLAEAEKEYLRLTASRDLAVRAEALMRLGRVRRKQNNFDGALRAYADLQTLGSIPVAGQPAELVARQVRYRITQESSDRDDFARALHSGAAKVDKPTFEFCQAMLQEWGGPKPPGDSLVRTNAALALWRRWKAGQLPPRGREWNGAGPHPTLALWSGTPEKPVVRILAASELKALLSPVEAQEGLEISVSDGAPGPGEVILTSGETGLPFLLRVSPGDTWEHPASFASGRNALIAGLAVTFVLMLAAAYGLYRTTSREMALVRQQADFVSAVSHEFRTPLTSMRHLTDLLVRQGVPSEERKAQYYELLSQETERLHQMVESLLSFGRMQAGSYAWRLEPTDANELVCASVGDFRRQPQAQAHEVICEAGAELPLIQADHEALSRAVSNLLENAGKYSEPGTPIRVSTRHAGNAIEISVEDRGPGIAPAEQKRVFDKFIRGENARRAGTRGIGIGLALVKSVAEAHGGTVKLSSEPGRGSIFTLVIPCLES
jgi:signal transduction histidine kinase